MGTIAFSYLQIAGFNTDDGIRRAAIAQGFCQRWLQDSRFNTDDGIRKAAISRQTLV